MSNTEHNKFRVKSLSEINKTREQVKPETVSVKEPQVTIQLLRHGKYTYISPHTGKKYSWTGAGTRVKVPEKDAGFLLAIIKEVGGCCGSKPQHIKIFMEVK